MAKDTGRNPKVTVGPRNISVALRPDAVDRLALDFCKTLARKRVKYALVSGYVAILLGRNRLSEDVDLFTERLTQGRFLGLHRALTEDFDCITPGHPSRLFRDKLDAGSESTSVRYARPGTFAPNVEMKFVQKPIHRYSVSRRVAVQVNGQRV